VGVCVWLPIRSGWQGVKFVQELDKAGGRHQKKKKRQGAPAFRQGRKGCRGRKKSHWRPCPPQDLRRRERGQYPESDACPIARRKKEKNLTDRVKRFTRIGPGRKEGGKATQTLGKGAQYQRIWTPSQDGTEGRREKEKGKKNKGAGPHARRNSTIRTGTAEERSA